jgi:hypothetical protein
VKKSNNNERDKLTKEIFTRIQDRVKYGLDKFRTIFWQNPRPKNQGGWRLSDFGYMVLKELEYKDYPINIPKETVLTGQTILYMDKYLDGPWFLEDKTIHFFKEKTAFQIILFDGDVNNFGKSREKFCQIGKDFA